MIRTFVLISLFFCGLCSSAWADDNERPPWVDNVKEYMVGGQEFVPDAEYFTQLCESPKFNCRKVRPGETWADLFPDVKTRDLVQRLNRTNVPLRYRSMLIEPRDMDNLNYQQWSPLPTHKDTNGKRLLYIDLDLFAFGAYDKDGALVKWGPASGGKPWCEDTKSGCSSAIGKFHVYQMRGEFCQSGTYPIEENGGAPMPYCMYYHKGFAIHGSTLSGFINRSRGCVRLFDEDAKWLNKRFVRVGTEVIVHQS